ncbi:MAG: hypothetical protein FWC79_05545 [Oscillospiraceae bacterium]|nr:hypothetical protein [Oscillospiraceae bacterium]
MRDVGTYRITEEDVARARAIKGLIQDEKKTVIEELLDVSEKLVDLGVDFTKIRMKENYRYKTIKNIIEEQGIEEKLKEQGVDVTVLEEFDSNYEIGSAISMFRSSYNGHRNK